MKNDEEIWETRHNIEKYSIIKEETKYVIDCLKCRKELKVQLVDDNIKCPHCQTKFKVNIEVYLEKE